MDRGNEIMNTVKKLIKGKSLAYAMDISRLWQEEQDEREYLHYRVRYASEAVRTYAMMLHAREWCQFYTIQERYQCERAFELSGGFQVNDFSLWASGD